jgi:hypothetical protein
MGIDKRTSLSIYLDNYVLDITSSNLNIWINTYASRILPTITSN